MNYQPSNFWQWLSSLDQHEQVPMMLILIITVAVLIALVALVTAFTVYKVHRNRLNDALKRELMERGTPAEDIVAIVSAAPSKHAARDFSERK